MFKYIVLFSFVCGSTVVMAQPSPKGKTVALNNAPTTEKEILLEAAYIEATAQRILGNDEKAIAIYQEILQKDSENAMVYFELSKIYEAQNNMSEALLRAQRAYNIGANQGEHVYFALQYAKILEQQGDYQTANTVYTKLIEKHPLEPRYYLSSAYLLTKLNKEDQAIKVYNALENKIGVTPEISNRKYKLYLSTNKEKLAEKELEQLAKALPLDLDANLLLARHYKNTNQAALSQKSYAKVLELDPRNSEASLATSSNIKNDGDEIGYLESMQRVFESTEHAVSDKNKILQPLVEKTLANPANKNSNYSIALMNLAAKNAQLHTDNYEANYYYAQLADFNQQYDLAIAAYTQALKTYKNNIQLWEKTLLLAVQTANTPILKTYSAEFFELYPSHLQAYLFESLSLSKQKSFKNASSIAQEAIMMVSDQYSYELCLQLISYLSWQGQKNKEKANKAWARVQELLSNNKRDIVAYNELILVLQSTAAFDKQDFQGVKDILKPLVESNTATPLMLELYADACAKLDQTAQAIMYWEKAKKNGNRSTTLDKKIQDKEWISE